MKKQILSEEFSRMQKLAGILTEETTTPNIEKLKDKAEDIADSPEFKNIIANLASKLTDEQKKKILNFTSGVNEDLGDFTLDGIIDKVNSLNEGPDPLAYLGLGTATVAPAIGMIKGMLLGGGPAALAAVATPVGIAVVSGLLIYGLAKYLNKRFDDKSKLDIFGKPVDIKVMDKKI